MVGNILFSLLVGPGGPLPPALSFLSQFHPWVQEENAQAFQISELEGEKALALERYEPDSDVVREYKEQIRALGEQAKWNPEGATELILDFRASSKLVRRALDLHRVGPVGFGGFSYRLSSGRTVTFSESTLPKGLTCRILMEVPERPNWRKLMRPANN